MKAYDEDCEICGGSGECKTCSQHGFDDECEECDGTNICSGCDGEG